MTQVVYESARLIVTSLALPPGGPLVLLAIGLLLWRRRPRSGRWLCLIGAVILCLASLPIVAAALVTALGGSRPLDPVAAREADAIVILGGGVRPNAVEYGGDTLGRLTLERVRYGAFLAKAYGLPLAVAGGRVSSDVQKEAELMRDTLASEYGVRVRWVDSDSRNTLENANNIARLLRLDDKHRVVLVMHGFDVRRARQLFEKAGLQVIAAPTYIPRWDGLSVRDFLPSAAALQTSYFAAYELLALARDAIIRRR